MANTEIYYTNWCPYCHQAKALLDRKGVDYTGIDLTHAGAEEIQAMRERSGRTSVPQIFIDDRHIGGFDDLAALERAGELDSLLSGEIKESA
jgi:glutaredoxin 3